MRRYWNRWAGALVGTVVMWGGMGYLIGYEGILNEVSLGGEIGQAIKGPSDILGASAPAGAGRPGNHNRRARRDAMVASQVGPLYGPRVSQGRARTAGSRARSSRRGQGCGQRLQLLAKKEAGTGHHLRTGGARPPSI